MAFQIESILAIAIGIGLAAATGFRVFLPLLIAGAAARWGGLPLASGFQWLSSTSALIALGTAGVFASASAMVDVPPGIMWPVAILAGGGIAGLTKGMSALIRLKTGLATAG